MAVVTYHRRNLLLNIGNGIAHHDWLQVGDYHWEIDKKTGSGVLVGQLEFNCETKPTGPPGQGVSLGGHPWPKRLGTTRKTSAEMREFVEGWMEYHKGRYELTVSDCQTFTREFANFLEVNCNLMPIREGAGGLLGVAGIAAAALPGGYVLPLPKNLPGSVKGFAMIKNGTACPIMVSTYDEKDTVQWKSFQNKPIEAFAEESIAGTEGAFANKCTSFHVHIYDHKGNQLTKSWGYKVKTGNKFEWNGERLILSTPGPTDTVVPGQAFMMIVVQNSDSSGSESISRCVALHMAFATDKRDSESSYACIHDNPEKGTLWTMEAVGQGFMLKVLRNFDSTGGSTRGRYLTVHQSNGDDNRDVNSAYVIAHSDRSKAGIWKCVKADGLSLLQLVDNKAASGQGQIGFYLAAHSYYECDKRDAESSYLMVHRHPKKAMMLHMQKAESY